jgi:hypothetical protein
MKPLLLLIAAALALSGAGLICCPQWTRRLFRKTLSDTDIRVMASLPLCIGAVFFLSALVDPRLLYLYLLLGSFAFLKGIYLLCAPPDQVRSVMAWWLEGASPVTLTIYGIVYLILAGYIGCSALFH